ncbi:hypothetical protein GGTG_08472 [Gaeumannomyces tritici R3-111a-1]|uniref:NAD(P)-binding domain-containing protein n=1 Tax=Gaeumannomyces tritici (strain R3-111a-1) TaxID=644352 RepID=J3P4N5_GAET3|nr:hypothetical protein GGTG_08472 [Gaeumannomyces tritici R3-111a-1]EJT74632.1 hypothetical protein GGTG_08472 [Gaeumannomyces tritici R3-111a-1]
MSSPIKKVAVFGVSTTGIFNHPRHPPTAPPPPHPARAGPHRRSRQAFMSLTRSPPPPQKKKASGNLGAPITAALLEAGFDVTAITRASSSTPSSLAPSVRVLRTTDDSYSDDDGGQLRALLTGHDAAALAKFPTAMGFDVPAKTATLYDGGARQFTGTTLEGIGRAVAGVLRRPDATANRHVRVRSAQTCQRELLAAFRAATAAAGEWEVREASAAGVRERGRAKRRDGVSGWTLDLAVAQLYMEESEEEEEEGARRRCFVASREESDNELLGVREESVDEIVAKALLASS